LATTAEIVWTEINIPVDSWLVNLQRTVTEVVDGNEVPNTVTKVNFTKFL